MVVALSALDADAEEETGGPGGQAFRLELLRGVESERSGLAAGKEGVSCSTAAALRGNCLFALKALRLARRGMHEQHLLGAARTPLAGRGKRTLRGVRSFPGSLTILTRSAARACE
jgi:hypothetical protein